MPLLDPDRARPPVVGVAEDYAKLTPHVHAHRRAQLIYASTGSLVIRLADAAYVLPPTRALFVPGGIAHAVATERPTSLRTLYFDPKRVRAIPRMVTVLSVSSLAREVIVALSSASWSWRAPGREARLCAVLQDELARAPTLPLRLPRPSEPRVARAAALLEADPTLDLPALGRLVGSSVRTLSRAWVLATGLTFVRWREQLRLLSALSRLATGRSVLEVAFDLGYASPSAFGAMFKRALGTSPARFFQAARSS